MELKTISPELYLIGAGPGDPELLTVKGYKALQQAAVILYDNLANKELMDIAPPTCEKIYVGKLPYGEYTPQETIHELIREHAYKSGRVVRLKGGDPFIFGRGFEELIYARQHGIKTFYIPGISSMQTTGLEDIPLTHKGISEGIWVMMGTKKDNGMLEDLKLAMQSNITIVIYMGMKYLSAIAETYRFAGKGATPAAVIQHASLPQQRSVKGTVIDLPELAEQHGLSHPAIIVIGEVAGLAKTFISPAIEQ